MKTFVTDIATDLVEKRLWPLALALVVALVALPVVLTRGGEAAPTTPAPVPATPAGAAAPPADASLVRLDTGPAIARKRAGRLRNPFAGTPSAAPAASAAATTGAQSAAGAASTGSGSSAATSATSATSARSVAATVPAIGDTSVSTPAPVPVSTSTGSTGSTGSGRTVTTKSPSTSTDDDAPSTYSVTLRFGPTDGERRTLRDVARLTVLPDPDDAVVGLLGVLRDGRTASFVPAPNVTATGEGTCRPSKQDCKTVELRAGDAEYLRVAGADGRPDSWYYLELLHVDRDEAGSARQAAAAYARRSGAGAAVIRKAAASVRHVRYLPARGVLVRAKRSAGGQAAARVAAGLVPLLPAPEQPGIAVWRSRKPAPPSP